MSSAEHAELFSDVQSLPDHASGYVLCHILGTLQAADQYGKIIKPEDLLKIIRDRVSFWTQPVNQVEEL